jgi:prolyl-tRNA editing enzyme YbaK/EbsC (Cys-tRNA(Pro) deacylase)
LRSSVDVHNYLLGIDVPHELPPLPGVLRDLSDAPDVLGLEPVAVARPAVLGDAQGVVVVLTPADVQADVAVVGRQLRRPHLAPVSPERSPGLTGYLLPTVPPVALDCPAEVVVDERVAAQDVVYTAAGEAGVILKIRGYDLVKATNAVLFPVTGDSSAARD